MKEYTHPYAHCRVIYNSQDLETAQMPISRRVAKKALVHLHNEILHRCKKEGNLTFATTWIGLENTILSEISQSEEDKYHMISLICGI